VTFGETTFSFMLLNHKSEHPGQGVCVIKHF